MSETGLAKQVATENAASLFNLLSHHTKKPTGHTNLLGVVPDANKVAWHNIPEDAGNPSDDDNNGEMELMMLDGETQQAGDSDAESGGDSDIDVLQSAGVWSDVETVTMHLAHLSKLKVAYTGEFDRLRQVMGDSRKRYLRDVVTEKKTMTSIHKQAKESVRERKVYKDLKAMLRYHKHNGRQALLRNALLEKRNNTNTTESLSKERVGKQNKFCCVYNQGSWKCGEKAVPMARHCIKHILEDRQQMLYRACGSLTGGADPCITPIIPLPHVDTCVYHTPLPLHTTQSTNEDQTGPGTPESLSKKGGLVLELDESASVMMISSPATAGNASESTLSSRIAAPNVGADMALSSNLAAAVDQVTPTININTKAMSTFSTNSASSVGATEPNVFNNTAVKASFSANFETSTGEVASNIGINDSKSTGTFTEDFPASSSDIAPDSRNDNIVDAIAGVLDKTVEGTETSASCSSDFEVSEKVSGDAYKSTTQT